MASVPTPTSLRQLLTQRKPSIQCTTTNTGNTKKRDWPEVRYHVTLWDDFNLDTLNESYGPFLDRPIEQPLDELPQLGETLEGLVIRSDRDTSRLIDWNYALMKPTIDFAQAQLGIQHGSALLHSHSTAENAFRARIPNKGNRLQVDHFISVSSFPTQNLVVGLARTSTKWQGLALATTILANQQPNKEQFWPLRQLSEICKVAQTRYGYIQTDELLLACNFWNVEGDQWGVAIKPIPVGNFGENALTADLALWWMSMLALSSRENSAIVTEQSMVRINAWEEVEIEGRGRVKRH